MKKLLLLLPILVLGCTSDESVDPDKNKEFNTGKNRYTTMVDGDSREYYVHVPSGYDAGKATPVVFMLHGTSGDGEKFYNISGWKEVGEVENILTVYPSSWHYCIIDDGVVKNTTKWHVFPGSFDYCAGQVPRDDNKFLRQIVAELKQRFNIDDKRIYLAGFSNGGQMAGRCAVEMSDVFAAIVESAGSLPKDTTYIPKRNLPVLFQLGNSDNLWLPDSIPQIPMSTFEFVLNNSFLKRIIQTHTSTFGLDSTYTISGDASTYLTATYRATPPDPLRVFHFTLIKNLEHAYPNGINHPLKSAEIHWEWFKQFALP